MFLELNRARMICVASTLFLCLASACASSERPGLERQSMALSTDADFNADNQPDILWHDTASGSVQAWLMSNNVKTGSASITNSGGIVLYHSAPWHAVGADDFNGDGKVDLVWHNDSTGVTEIWYMSGTVRIGVAAVDAELDGGGANVGEPWRIAGTGDFNQDGWPDILWHNTSTGEPQIWYMQNSSRTHRYTLVPNDGGSVYVSNPWSIVAVNRFNAASPWPGILWYNSSTGESQIWFMQNFYRMSRASLVGATGSVLFVGPPWSIAATSNFDKFGSADILWHNSVTNQSQIWYMSSNARASTANLALPAGGGDALQGPPWEIVRH